MSNFEPGNIARFAEAEGVPGGGFDAASPRLGDDSAGTAIRADFEPGNISRFAGFVVWAGAAEVCRAGAPFVFVALALVEVAFCGFFAGEFTAGGPVPTKIGSSPTTIAADLLPGSITRFCGDGELAVVLAGLGSSGTATSADFEPGNIARLVVGALDCAELFRAGTACRVVRSCCTACCCAP